MKELYIDEKDLVLLHMDGNYSKEQRDKIVADFSEFLKSKDKKVGVMNHDIDITVLKRI